MATVGIGRPKVVTAAEDRVRVDVASIVRLIGAGRVTTGKEIICAVVVDSTVLADVGDVCGKVGGGPSGVWPCAVSYNTQVF